jgi:hypothetical protein
MGKSKGKYFLIGMILLSLALGIFISYFFVFVNALFISEIGTSKLPMAYLTSGIGGLFITWAFNSAEKKWGFAKASTVFGLFFALVMFLIWYAYIQGLYLYYVVFFAYAWFWVSSNFTALVFWKLPSNIFNLEENKKYNGIISSGEGISAIISYLSVPALLTLDFFTRDKFLLISFMGILAFSGITYFLGRGIVVKAPVKNVADNQVSSDSNKNLVKERYFQLIFLSILLSVVIQFVIDFCLMEVSANQMSDPLELAKYFSFIFGGMRVLELILKSFVSKFLIKEYGVFISLSSLIFALGFTTIIGISTYFTGYLGLILIVASLGKVFERSLYRSLYAPTINLLYQAYPMAKRSLTQNYADGFGRTFGQLVAAVFIFGISFIAGFELKVLSLLVLVLVVLIVWLFVSKKLIFYYREELFNILKGLNVTTSSQGATDADKRESNVFALEVDPVKHLIQLTKQLLMHEYSGTQSSKNLPVSHSSLSLDMETNQVVSITEEVIATALACNSTQLLKILDQLGEINKTQPSHSRLIELIELFLQATLIQKSTHFSFYNSQKKLKAVDFLHTTVIQHLVKKQVQDLDNQDYYFLLEERIQKYTYLLNCYKDIGKTYPILGKLLLSETKAAKNDILFCLSFKHDPVTLNQIVTMINQGGDKSQELISLELLELILEEQEKKWVLPIFKENTPEKILNKLASDFPQVLLGQEKRLLSLVTSYNLDIPELIKSQALLALHRDFPSQANQGLLNSLKKSNLRLAQLATANSTEEVQVENGQSEILPSAPFGLHLKNELLRYQASEELTSVHHFYWMNATHQTGGDAAENTRLKSVYRTLFPAVFPMEKLN